MTHTTDLVLEFMGEKVGVAIPPGTEKGTALPLAPGTASPGLSEIVSRQDHVHPVQQDVEGNAGTATKLAEARTFSLTGAASGLPVSFDGSQNIVIAVTTLDATKLTGIASVDTTGNAATASKLANGRTIALSGAVSGSGSFDGTNNLNITTTSNIDALQLGNIVGQTSGTASAGTATTAARSDHVHPLQTTVSGNAGSATKLQTARTISLSGAVSGSGSFDGSGNLAITTTSNTAGLQLGNTVGSSPGTAAAGTATTAARSDHVHPLQTTVSGNSGTATKLATARTITLAGVVSGSASFDGSGNVTITTTGGSTLQLGNSAGSSPGTAAAGIATTAARSDHVHPLQTTVSGNAGTATKLATARTITLSGDCSGSTSFDGSGNITITTTVVNGGVQLGSTVGQAAGIAAAGTATTAARTDHVHPLQTTVTGNAGTATKWTTARTISLAGTVTGSASLDGSANVSITTRVNNTSGGEIKFWTGTTSQLPSSRTSDTIYFVTD